MPDLKTKQQVIDQYKVVVHLARAIALVHEQSGEIWAADDMPPMMIDMLGRRSASFMEKLGDMLNAMDAVDEEDAWTNPVFRAAQEAWPQP